MNIDELKTFSELFYDSNRIPICCCDSQLQIHAFYPENISANAFSHVANDATASNLSMSFITDQQFLHWGYIRDAESGNYLLIGPVSSLPLTDQGVRAFMKDHIIPNGFFEATEKAFSNTPIMTIQQFLYIMRFLHYQINHVKVSDEELLRYLVPEDRTTRFYSKSNFYSKSADKTEVAHSFENAYNIEQALLYYIETGRINELRQHALTPDLPMPDVGITPMSQLKTSCVVIITVIARFVIKKGMDVNTAMRLSDIYLKGIETASNTKELTILITNAYVDYSERLQALKMPVATSPIVHSCIQYVRQMVNTPITVSDVAEYVDKSLSYISAKFKADTGFTLSSYITQCKIEEAKSLLQNTNMTIAEISSYLCFSDQSYFQKQFRKITGVTPLQYRKES